MYRNQDTTKIVDMCHLRSFTIIEFLRLKLRFALRRCDAFLMGANNNSFNTKARIKNIHKHSSSVNNIDSSTSASTIIQLAQIYFECIQIAIKLPETLIKPKKKRNIAQI